MGTPAPGRSVGPSMGEPPGGDVAAGRHDAVGDGASRRPRLRTIARRAWPLPVLVAAFLTLGLPSWLVGGGGPDVSRGEIVFANLCRDRGGTLTTARVPGGERRQLCTVRYGDRVYPMDAVTPEGWSERSAALERSGCAQALRRARSTAGGERRPVFVFHETTGVCERRR
jgi:hypothetical protein